MEWTQDVTAGEWIHERTDDPWRSTIHDFVPRGYAAYARIFHPAHRDRPVGEPWPGLPYAAHRGEWEAFQARDPEIVGQRVGWAETAAAMGTTMHPLAQWGSLVAPGRIVENEDGPRDAAGWRYSDPPAGDLEPDLVAAIAAHLAAHTDTPRDGHAALWEGAGGLVGYVGETPSRMFLQFTQESSDAIDHHNRMLAAATKDPFNTVFRTPTWQEGILSREISEGVRLVRPGRDYVLFRAGAEEFVAPDWVLTAPWRDHIGEAHGFPPAAQAPSLLWPADRAWFLSTEVDDDSTVVGGSAELVAAICADARLEALPLPAEAALTWDPINRDADPWTGTGESRPEVSS